MVSAVVRVDSGPAARWLFRYTPPPSIERRASPLEDATPVVTRSSMSGMPSLSRALRAISVEGTSAKMSSIWSAPSPSMDPPNSAPVACWAFARPDSPWDPPRHVFRQRLLGNPAVRLRLDCLSQTADFLFGQEREVLQVPNDVRIVGVDPELVEAER